MVTQKTAQRGHGLAPASIGRIFHIHRLGCCSVQVKIKDTVDLKLAYLWMSLGLAVSTWRAFNLIGGTTLHLTWTYHQIYPYMHVGFSRTR